MNAEEQLERVMEQNAILVAKNFALETELMAIKGVTFSTCTMLLSLLESVECNNDDERHKLQSLMSAVSETMDWVSE